jgi:hypothetical protein
MIVSIFIHDHQRVRFTVCIAINAIIPRYNHCHCNHSYHAMPCYSSTPPPTSWLTRGQQTSSQASKQQCNKPAKMPITLSPSLPSVAARLRHRYYICQSCWLHCMMCVVCRPCHQCTSNVILLIKIYYYITNYKEDIKIIT